jgi:hypothetical protein
MDHINRRDFLLTAGALPAWPSYPAKSLGLTIPQSVLTRADELIQ